MKILQVSSSYYPAFEIGGPITAVHDLNKTLVKKGIEVLVLTTNVKLESKVEANKIITHDGVDVIYFDYDSKFEFLGGTGWQYSKKLAEYFKLVINNFDVVSIIGVWNYPSTWAIRYCVKNKMHHIISPHGSFKPEHFKTKGWKKSAYYNLFLRKYLKNAFIHYFSKSEAKESLDFFKITKEPLVLANGVNVIEFDKKLNVDDFYKRFPGLLNKQIILSLCRLHPVKGLELLIDAFKNIDDDDVILVIAGSGDFEYENYLKYLVKKYSLENRVVFTGMVTGYDKNHLLKIASVFILLSYSEAFSMAILEALASGTPVIISNKCYFDEVQENNAGVIVNHEFNNIVEVIDNLIHDKKKLKIMSINAKKLADKYDWDSIADKCISVYKEIINDTI